MAKLKVYCIGHADGTHDYLTAATSMKVAAQRMGCALSYLAANGRSVSASEAVYAVAMLAPDKVWKRESVRIGAIFEVEGGTHDGPPVVVEWNVNNHCGTWEIDRAEWLQMTEHQRTELLNQFMQDEIGNHVDAGYAVVGEDGQKDRAGAVSAGE